MENDKNFDAIIIGGSYAGLSAAMALGRSLRQVLIIDSGLPCNRQTPHSHNFITHDGEKPSVITQKAKEQVLSYPTVRFQQGLAINGKKNNDGFEISTVDGEAFNAKKIIFATGIEDVMPDIQGFSACWGISVIHCPYCHGYEFSGKKTAIMANGERALHLASLVNNLSTDLTILTSGKANFEAEQAAKLEKHGIAVIEEEIVKIQHKNGWLEKVVFGDNSTRAFDTLYAAIPFKQHSAIPVELGCDLTEQGHIVVDNFQKTSVKGVFACGDNASMMRSISNAVAAGNLAGAMVNKELVEESF
ncbi:MULTISPECIES: NAD(P)/FAD-dependent oxidoreductase [Sphingobacterium]|uniref:Pyridine nucleotide-disulfide oxidoreductase n=1 Tax=Sphingobacterium athyrii TaxID=2152717 RepID=A0A363NYG6_9SPHI|nr:MULTISPECIES: NAD(P)/FAD-dependent oxidoreductase [Sphingobacterium]PUV25845.1 pyridine nucleotide-disulfide oxidoreductase [Sphingobacterium athyrii]QIH33279.1 NAD(P)/FAD-dependent oxidoreductase [Sphingobacterium sp. DR205]